MSQHKVLSNGTNAKEDRISQQPDNILVRILCLLTIKEAGSTSVVSRRWKNLWKSTNRLSFDAQKVIDKINSEVKCKTASKLGKLVASERYKYVSLVNNVLRLHESPSLDEFSIEFYLDASYSHHIDEWIMSIIQRKVKRVSIRLLLPPPGENEYFYTLSDSCFKGTENLPNIKCLSNLSLFGVNVSGELLEYLVSNCRLLERLSVSHSNHLSSLKVASPSIQLKHLAIRRCYNLESVELCAPKLAACKFAHATKIKKFLVGDNPRLGKLTIGELESAKLMTDALVAFSGHLPELKTLSLEISPVCNMEIPLIPEFRQLKQLKLTLRSTRGLRLATFTGVILSCSSLEKFRLVFKSLWEEKLAPTCDSGCAPLLQTHHCLKEVEMEGYAGGRFEYELGMYLSRSAVNLKTMVIKPLRLSNSKLQERKKVQRDFGELKKSLPPKAKLIVL